jgi:hypothetical protein
MALGVAGRHGVARRRQVPCHPLILLGICALGRFPTKAAPDVAGHFVHPKAPLMTGITVTKQQKMENLQ